MQTNPEARSRAGRRGPLPARSWRAALPMALSGALAALAIAGTAIADPASTRLRLFFSNDRLASDPGDCAAVFMVERSVPKTGAVATAALNQLFAGPTPAEREAGYRSFFSPATAGLLRRVRIRGGTAYVDLHDLRERLSGATSSCGAAEFQSQMSRTLRQFPAVERVIYAIEGDPRRFYEWQNEPCSRANDDCDARPFKAGG